MKYKERGKRLAQHEGTKIFVLFVLFVVRIK